MAGIQGDLDYQKMQVVTALGTVATSMRQAADMIEQFGNAFGNAQFGGNLNLQSLQHFAAASQVLNSLPQTNVLDMKMAAAQGAPHGNGASLVEGKPDKRKRGEGKVKKYKDPHAPKRPPSAYLLFQNEVRKDMQALHPDKPYHEVLSEISKRWSSMSEEQKLVYNTATAAAKEKYNASKAHYDSMVQNGSYVPGTGGSFPAAIVPVPVVAEEDSDDSDDSDSDDSDDSRPATKKAKSNAAPPSSKKEKKHKQAAA